MSKESYPDFVTLFMDWQKHCRSQQPDWVNRMSDMKYSTLSAKDANTIRRQSSEAVKAIVASKGAIFPPDDLDKLDACATYLHCQFTALEPYFYPPQLLRDYLAAFQEYFDEKAETVSFSPPMSIETFTSARTYCASLRNAIRRERSNMKTQVSNRPDLKPGEWYETKYGITTARLRRAKDDGRLEAVLVNKRYQYSFADVRKIWPHDVDET